MKRIGLSVLIWAALFGSAHAETWTCSAAKMASGSYDGGSMAYIHLSPYPNGKPYPVARKGKVATGKTSDGTSFVCRQS